MAGLSYERNFYNIGVKFAAHPQQLKVLYHHTLMPLLYEQERIY